MTVMQKNVFDRKAYKKRMKEVKNHPASTMAVRIWIIVALLRLPLRTAAAAVPRTSECLSVRGRKRGDILKSASLLLLL